MVGEIRESQVGYATSTVTLDIPAALYHRLQQAATALRISFNDVVLHTLQVGSPPAWDDVPAEFQADLAALDRLGNDALWNIALGSAEGLDWERYQELLNLNAERELTDAGRRELENLRARADRHVLRKAHAAALLRWRGCQVSVPLPPQYDE